jgi:hypothetical protein
MVKIPDSLVMFLELWVWFDSQLVVWIICYNVQERRRSCRIENCGVPTTRDMLSAFFSACMYNYLSTEATNVASNPKSNPPRQVRPNIHRFLNATS